MARPFASFLFAAALLSPALLFAQPSPEVGNAVLLATHGIQVDRDVTVMRGDAVVNDAGGVLSLDQGVQTPAGFSVKADTVRISAGAVVSGDVRSNILQNNGTITGQVLTPLALPVIATLPAQVDRASGTQDVTVANGQTSVLGTGDYANLSVGRDATLRLGGGPYTFASITTERGASILWDGPGEVVVNGAFTLGQGTTIGAPPPVTTKHKMFFAHGSVSIGKDASISATIFAPAGTIDADTGLSLTGSFVAQDIHVSRGATLTLRSGFFNHPPVANDQTITILNKDPLVITLTGSDADLDPLRFNIGLPPSNGTLGPVLPSGPTSAVVVYTPNVARPNDIFTFHVIDSENVSAEGVVTINEGLPLPGPPTTVKAASDFVEVPPDRPSILILKAIGPPGVQITVSIVPGSGPTFGTLGPVQQQQVNPFRPAQVPYAPNPGFVGEDAFQFQACGVVSGSQVCDVATMHIAVKGPETSGELAPDFNAYAVSGELLPITLATSHAPATYQITSLPANGTLVDTNGVVIASVPYQLPSGIVSFRSANNFTGTTSFTYAVTSAGPTPVTDFGTVTVVVAPAPGSESGGTLAPDLTVTTVSGTPSTFSLLSAPTATVYRVVTLPT
ncbi:MAG TPA: hypothetical protein VG323_12550, partial [Thermoanaerobaculia bacterium]|nr:hypothetical protein [Thermoanaerobaculia bacterium]